MTCAGCGEPLKLGYGEHSDELWTVALAPAEHYVNVCKAGGPHTLAATR